MASQKLQKEDKNYVQNNAHNIENESVQNSIESKKESPNEKKELKFVEPFRMDILSYSDTYKIGIQYLEKNPHFNNRSPVLKYLMSKYKRI